ncbi:MAG: alpha/beta hydrolase family protein [Flavobacteriales bacterium]|jgi:dienelactone hydrolase
MKKILFAAVLILLEISISAQSTRPQTPKPPFEYIEKEVVITNPNGGHTLAGTLTMPKKGKGFKAAILITGSGPQDRDETLMDHKPFAIIADDFAKQGIAVLRIDDRGIGKSKGNFETATSADFATDIAACFDYLKKQKKVDKTKIGLIGHSEGGMVAAMTAAMRPEVAFVISLAGTGVNGRSVLYQQNMDIMLAAGASKKDAEANRNNVMRMLDIVMTETDSAKVTDRLMLLMDTMLGPQKAMIPNLEEFKRNQVAGINSDWMRFFLKYEPSTDWKKVKCPVLILNGDKDLQVNAEVNTKAIESALKSGGNTQFKTVIFQGMNHLFQTCEKCTIQEYDQLEESFSVQVLDEMRKFIRNL